MFLLISFRSDIIVPQILLPLKVPQISQINTVFLPSPAIPRRSHPAKHGEGKKQAVPRRSHPAKYGEGFDAPPTLERSGSEHRRAVTSLALLERARAWEWVKDPPAGEGQVGQKHLFGKGGTGRIEKAALQGGYIPCPFGKGEGLGSHGDKRKLVHQPLYNAS